MVSEAFLFKDRLFIINEISLQLTDERRKQVIDLYFDQHKTYAEIAQIMKMSPRDIHAIIKEEEGRRQKYKDKQQQEETSSKAYKLFSDRKTPLEVAIELNVEESEMTKFYREYWKLKHLHNLNMVYEELRGDIEPFSSFAALMGQNNNNIVIISGRIKSKRTCVYDYHYKYFFPAEYK